MKIYKESIPGKIRGFLISLIAGKRLVVMNAIFKDGKITPRYE